MDELAFAVGLAAMAELRRMRRLTAVVAVARSRVGELGLALAVAPELRREVAPLLAHWRATQ